jgi:hypothetical protein
MKRLIVFGCMVLCFCTYLTAQEQDATTDYSLTWLKMTHKEKITFITGVSVGMLGSKILALSLDQNGIPAQSLTFLIKIINGPFFSMNNAILYLDLTYMKPENKNRDYFMVLMEYLQAIVKSHPEIDEDPIQW